MIGRKCLNLPIGTSGKKRNPTSHYWPKKSEQDAVRGGFFGDFIFTINVVYHTVIVPHYDSFVVKGLKS